MIECEAVVTQKVYSVGTSHLHMHNIMDTGLFFSKEPQKNLIVETNLGWSVAGAMVDGECW